MDSVPLELTEALMSGFVYSSCRVHQRYVCARLIGQQCPRERFLLAVFLSLHCAIGSAEKLGSDLLKLIYLTAFGLIPPSMSGLVSIIFVLLSDSSYVYICL